jgi:hypothetical protein
MVQATQDRWLNNGFVGTDPQATLVANAHGLAYAQAYQTIANWINDIGSANGEAKE